MLGAAQRAARDRHALPPPTAECCTKAAETYVRVKGRGKYLDRALDAEELVALGVAAGDGAGKV